MEPLNNSERRFAEENHMLIYSFLNLYKLPEEKYYDISSGNKRLVQQTRTSGKTSLFHDCL